jgi:hypothetical protein
MPIADIRDLNEGTRAVSEPHHQTIELRLAETGSELAPAIDAAQYARVISHDPAPSAAEERAIARFVAAFVDCAETWEDLEAVRRMGALAGLSAQLEALQRRGLFVHWAALEASIAEAGRRVRMPLAVLTVSRGDLPTAQVRLPGELEVTPESGPTAH